MSKSCIIVPCYNEAERLSTEAFRSFCSSNKDIVFLFVNDGSTDHTLSILQAFSRELDGKAQVLDLSKNGGKAEAVRQGLRKALDADFTWIGYLDADLATPLTELPRMLRLAEENPDCKVILGSRIKRMGARIERNPMRHYIGRVFATAAGTLLKLPVYDTQCGAKLLHRSVLSEVLQQPFTSAWLFDVELLGRIRNHFGTEKTLQICLEMPLLQWEEIGGSKLRLKHFLRLPFELWKVHRAVNRKHFYQQFK